MEVALTEFETAVFRSAWIARKDVSLPEFMKIFRPIWEKTAEEIENLSRQCGYSVRLLSSRVAFTLRPNVTLAFSPEANGYLINVWYFLFWGNDKGAIINQSTFLASEFVHEESHREYCQEHNMLCQDEKTTSNFINEFHYEIEKNAISKEIGFLQKAKTIVPANLNVRSFLVKSWSETGVPTSEIISLSISPQRKLEISMINCERELQDLTQLSQTNFKGVMAENKISYYTDLSKALNLSEPVSCSIIEIPKER